MNMRLLAKRWAARALLSSEAPKQVPDDLALVLGSSTKEKASGFLIGRGDGPMNE